MNERWNIREYQGMKKFVHKQNRLRTKQHSKPDIHTYICGFIIEQLQRGIGQLNLPSLDELFPQPIVTTITNTTPKQKRKTYLGAGTNAEAEAIAAARIRTDLYMVEYIRW